MGYKKDFDPRIHKVDVNILQLKKKTYFFNFTVIASFQIQGAQLQKQKLENVLYIPDKTSIYTLKHFV